MKRSDMQMVILRALAELDMLYPDGYGYEEQSDHILKRIEEAGMLPPPKEIDEVGSFDFSTPVVQDAQGHTYVTYSDFFKWESENDV